MIRVLYRWKVTPENFEEFRKMWRDTTNHIHETIPGALGSFLLRSSTDPEKVVTIAKWDSMESWQNFYQGEDPEQMRGLRTLGARLSVEAYEEVENQTK